MGKAVDPDKISITTAAALSAEFAQLTIWLNKDETEHTWEQIDKALKRLHACVRGGACKLASDFVRGIKEKEVVVGIIRSMATERTRLSATALSLIASCTRLGTSFLPLLWSYLPCILRLLSRTNKLYIQRAQQTLSSIIHNTSLGPEMIKYLVTEWKNEGGKSSSYRIGAIEAFSEILEVARGKEHEETREMEDLERRVEDVEWVIRTAATDREQKVRGVAKEAWEAYKLMWPSRVAQFTAPMTPVIRRYLNVPAGVATKAAEKPKVPTVLKPAPRPAPLAKVTSKPTAYPVPSTSTAPLPPKASAPTQRPVATVAPPRSKALSSSLGASSTRTQPPVVGVAPSLAKSYGPSRSLMDQAPPPPPSHESSAPSSRSASRNEERPPPVSSTSTSGPSFRPGPARSVSSTLSQAQKPMTKARRVLAPPPVVTPLPNTTTLTSAAPARARPVNTSATSALSNRPPRPPISAPNRPPRPPPTTSAPFRPTKPVVKTRPVVMGKSPEVSKATIAARERREAREAKEMEKVLEVAKETPLPVDEDEAGDVAFVESSDSTITASESSTMPEHTGLIPLPASFEAKLDEVGDFTVDASILPGNFLRASLMEEEEPDFVGDETEASMLVVDESEVTVRLVQDTEEAEVVAPALLPIVNAVAVADEEPIKSLEEVAHVTSVLEETEGLAPEPLSHEAAIVVIDAPSQIETAASGEEEIATADVAVVAQEVVAEVTVEQEESLADIEAVEEDEPPFTVELEEQEEKTVESIPESIPEAAQEDSLAVPSPISEAPTPSPLLAEELARPPLDTFVSSSEVYHDSPPPSPHTTTAQAEWDSDEPEPSHTCSIILETPPRLGHTFVVAIPGHYHQTAAEGPFTVTQTIEDDVIETSFAPLEEAIEQTMDAFDDSDDGRSFLAPLNDAANASSESYSDLDHSVDPEAQTAIIRLVSDDISADSDDSDHFMIEPEPLRFQDEDSDSHADDEEEEPRKFAVLAPSIPAELSSPPRHSEEDEPVLKRSLRNRTVCTPLGGVTLRRSRGQQILGDASN